MDRGKSAGRRRSRGFTLLEVTISIAVFAVLLEAVMGGVLAMTRSTQFGDKRSRLLAKVARALDVMGAELNLTTTDDDPVTGLPYVTVNGTGLQQSITFKRVVNFGNNGSELVPIWSTDITYAINGFALERSQDGVTTEVMQGATQLEFVVEPSGRILVTVAAIAGPDNVAPDSVVQVQAIPTSKF